MEPIKLIPLHQGRAEVWGNGAENYSVHLTYDISNHLKSWPDAAPSVAFERADGEKYPHAWELDGPVLHIPLLMADTEIPGMCKCMITLLSGEGRANTVVFYGSVTQGIDSLGETPADPLLGIIEQVNEDAAETYKSQQAALASEQSAAASAASAAESAEAAAASAAAAAKSESNAAAAYTDANAAKENAQTAAANAANSETGANTAASSAQQNAVYAIQARESAKGYADNAAASASAATTSEENAAQHAQDAQDALENMEERYYVPAVSADGDLSFTPTSDEMPDVPTVNIRGPQGEQGPQGIQGERGPSGLPDYTANDVNKMLYVDPTASPAWLAVGHGLKVENGVLMLDIGTEADVYFTQTADETIMLNGVAFVQRDDGTVFVDGAEFTAQIDDTVMVH